MSGSRIESKPSLIQDVAVLKPKFVYKASATGGITPSSQKKSPRKTVAVLAKEKFLSFFGVMWAKDNGNLPNSYY